MTHVLTHDGEPMIAALVLATVLRPTPGPVVGPLPPAPPVVATLQPPRLGGPPRRSVLITYRVCRGDTLWAIAARFSGGGEHWRWIVARRDLKRPDPYLLHAGQLLVVPEVSA